MSATSHVVAQEHVSREGKPTYFVSTVRLSVEHHGGMWYETYIFPSDGEKVSDWGEVWGKRYATEAEARTNHPRIVAMLREGELVTYDGETL